LVHLWGHSGTIWANSKGNNTCSHGVLFKVSVCWATTWHQPSPSLLAWLLSPWEQGHREADGGWHGTARGTWAMWAVLQALLGNASVHFYPPRSDFFFKE
jgi:hypothetical protein